MEHEPLVDLNDLHRLHAHVDVAEEVQLHIFGEDRHEGQRSNQRVVTEVGGRFLAEKGRVVALDSSGKLAALLTAHDEVVRVPPNHPADIGLERHKLR